MLPKQTHHAFLTHHAFQGLSFGHRKTKFVQEVRGRLLQRSAMATPMPESPMPK
jgi:hypothetical protein